ncbi:MAG: thiamine pyrophosphate-dependent dehydrogenase E1 component subunit alpha [Desulfotomaculaceae bacterium]|nr:thiamine pyrophosphate-dependent dehydrogenase E1 component subunit alpha [Desulfotomaculaceae bacterium]
MMLDTGNVDKKDNLENKDRLLKRFFKQMLLIRKVEEKILDSYKKGLYSGTTHTYIGQEACAVGVINALNLERDIILSNHRCHGHFLTYSADVVGLFGELMGKEIGVCRGVGGSQHLQKANFYTNGIQGGIVPCATGMAFAEKVKNTGAIVTAFLGDGTLGQGVVYEAFNLAALWSLPIFFVVEHNQYAQSTPARLQHAGNLAGRAVSFDIKTASLAASCVLDVYELAQKATEYVREASKPFFLMLHTYRLAPHSKGDDFRDPAEIAEHSRKDPLLMLQNQLDQVFVSEMEKEVEGIVDEAFQEAMRASTGNISLFH